MASNLISPFVPMGQGGLPSWLESTNPNNNPAAGADTSGTSLTSFGPGQPAANLAADTSYGNLQAAGNIETLTNLINNLNAQNQQMLNKSRLGESGQAVQDQLLSNTADWAAGKISPGTTNTIEAAMAQRGAGGGFGVDSANTNAAMMRALGLTSEGLQRDAIGAYGSLLADNPSAPLYGAQSNLVTPAVYAGTADRQAQLQLEYERLAAAQRAAAQGVRGIRIPTGTSSGMTGTSPSPMPAPSTSPGTNWGWNFQPGGTEGSSVFGGIDLGNMNYLDMFDPSGGLAPQFGSMPDYSTAGGGIDPIASAFDSQYDPSLDAFSDYWGWGYDQG